MADRTKMLLGIYTNTTVESNPSIGDKLANVIIQENQKFSKAVADYIENIVLEYIFRERDAMLERAGLAIRDNVEELLYEMFAEEQLKFDPEEHTFKFKKGSMKKKKKFKPEDVVELCNLLIRKGDGLKDNSDQFWAKVNDFENGFNVELLAYRIKMVYAELRCAILQHFYPDGPAEELPEDFLFEYDDGTWTVNKRRVQASEFTLAT